jgi:hypothetical protein
MGALLNIRHELFARAYLKYKDGKRAYWLVYPDCKYACAKVGASRLKRHPKVRKRIKELRHYMAKRADITVDKILGDYQQALEMAKEQQKPNDIVNAATAQAKLVGLLRDRIETGSPGDFANMDNISEILEAVAEQAGPEVALALSKAFNLTETQPEPPQEPIPAKDSVDIESIEPPTDAVN